MIWWLRTHRVILLAAVCIAVSLVSSLLGTVSFLFPKLEGGGPFGAVPLYAALPLAVSITVSTLLGEADKPVYRTAARPRLLYDWLFSVAAIVLSCGTALLTLFVAGPGAIETMRNLVGFVGLQWIVAPYLSYRYQAIVPVLYVFVAAVFGRAPGGQGHIALWAWPLAPSTDSSFWIIPVIACLVGSIVALTRGPALPRIRY
ncbi:hypothetical protein ITJ38_17785 [Agreia pratensis]|uniref:hypothetical protein n=1 Tax=Agreia pratensis TaxID=150121 RepID=UPI00188D8E5E|nr:hypothetical protein [Agreia pratensis]MBF4636266.1 hypothetical protein [Agreia pratensis]